MTRNDADREAIRIIDDERRELEWWLQGPWENSQEADRVIARINELRTRMRMAPLED